MSQNNNHIFSNDDCELITFVSHQIATVLQTKLATQALKSSHQELEYRVNEKTKALQQANLHLQMQIDERKKVEQQLYHDAHHDSLTGLPNRSLFLTQLEKTLQHYHRFPDHHFAVLFIDLDKFKESGDYKDVDATYEELLKERDMRNSNNLTDAFKFGIVTNTGFGDGEYKVYIKKESQGDWGERVSELKIVFIEDDPEEEEDEY